MTRFNWIFFVRYIKYEKTPDPMFAFLSVAFLLSVTLAPAVANGPRGLLAVGEFIISQFPHKSTYTLCCWAAEAIRHRIYNVKNPFRTYKVLYQFQSEFWDSKSVAE